MLSKKLKKVTSVIIAVFLSMSLVACGGDYVNETIDTANLINPAESFDKSASIEETVLADKSGIKITAKSLTYSGYKVIINLLMENNSGNDISILSNTLACSSNSVNSYMIKGGYLNCDISAGGRAEDTMSFDIQELILHNINSIAELDLVFYIDFDDYDVKDVLIESAKIETTLYDTYDYSKEGFENSLKNKNLKNWYGFSVDKESKDEITLTDTIGITYQAMITNKDENKMMVVNVENASQSPINVYIKNMYINGLYVADSVEYGEITPEKSYAAAVQINSILDVERMELLGMKDIGKVKYTFIAETTDRELITQKDIEFDVSKKDKFDDSGEVVFDQNDITIIYKGTIPSDSEYSKYTYVLFLVKNNSSKRIYVDDLNATLANKINVTSITYGSYVEPGECAFIDSKITDIDNLSQLQMSFKVTDDDNNIVAAPLININCQ